MSHPLIFTACALLNAGCVLGIGNGAARRIADPPLTMEKTRLTCDGLAQCLRPAKPSGATTKQQLRGYWGEPDKVEIVGKIERWTYKNDSGRKRAWGIFAVVPASLFVPTSHEKMTAEFAGDLVQRVEVDY